MKPVVGILRETGPTPPGPIEDTPDTTGLQEKTEYPDMIDEGRPTVPETVYTPVDTR